LLRQLVGITPDRTRDEAGAQLGPFVTGMMPDLAPWLSLLAIPFGAEVPVTAEVAALDPAASRDRLHWAVETFLERILMMPTLIVVGWALARRRFPPPARAPRRKVAHVPVVCVTTAQRAAARAGGWPRRCLGSGRSRRLLRNSSRSQWPSSSRSRSTQRVP
jgi:hypothetical protein